MPQHRTRLQEVTAVQAASGARRAYLSTNLGVWPVWFVWFVWFSLICLISDLDISWHILTYLDISWHILTVLEFVELCRLVEPPWGLLKDRCFNSTFQTRICSTKDATRTKKLHQNLPAMGIPCPVPTVLEKVSIVKLVPWSDHNRSDRNHLPRSSES